MGLACEAAVANVIIVAFYGRTWWYFHLCVCLVFSVYGFWVHSTNTKPKRSAIRPGTDAQTSYLFKMAINAVSIVASNVVPTLETSSPLPWVYLLTSFSLPIIGSLHLQFSPVLLGFWCLSQLVRHRNSAGCFELEVFFIGMVISMPIVLARIFLGARFPLSTGIAITCTFMWLVAGFAYVFTTEEGEEKGSFETNALCYEGNSVISSECLKFFQSAKWMFSYLAMWMGRHGHIQALIWPPEPNWDEAEALLEEFQKAQSVPNGRRRPAACRRI